KKSGILIIVPVILVIALIWGVVGYDVSRQIREVPDYIFPDQENPGYWSYKGEKILLLGGSVEDNLFQIDNLREHLELLRSCGGNFVRNTMSSRDSGNVWPFFQHEDGSYDLDRWNETYWQRFEDFLELTSGFDIIVQLEVWATFDFYREYWDVNPYNPANNVNYTAERTKLPIKVTTHPTFTENNFFRSIPSQMCLLRLLEYQQKYVDRLLSHSMKYGHVLYCMDNETSVTSEWGKFWADYIRRRGIEEGRELQTTEMWDPWNLGHIVHRETMDHPEIYTFVDISQNNHNRGEEHWQNGIRQLEHLRRINAIRPCNNVKVYGNDGGRHQTTQNGIECFIRNVMFGSAGTRFHRPTSGQGLNETAQSVIRSVRMMTEQMDFFNGKPIGDVFIEKDGNEAYCRGIPGKEYMIYFPDGGEVTVSLELGGKRGSIRWMQVLGSEWKVNDSIVSGTEVNLACPGPGNWIALIQ
ncbi:MAG: hypothetical protein KFF73_01335, partial [Cyclobacteriaceae bacterium]|nr:hypothetical protein [Cyclobacteriaceae bacterium]